MNRTRPRILYRDPPSDQAPPIDFVLPMEEANRLLKQLGNAIKKLKKMPPEKRKAGAIYLRHSRGKMMVFLGPLCIVPDAPVRGCGHAHKHRLQQARDLIASAGLSAEPIGATGVKKGSL